MALKARAGLLDFIVQLTLLTKFCISPWKKENKNKTNLKSRKKKQYPKGKYFTGAVPFVNSTWSFLCFRCDFL